MCAHETTAENPSESSSWVLSNSSATVVLSEENGGLVAFVDEASRYDFVGEPQPLYGLLLFRKDKELVEIDSTLAGPPKVEQETTPDGEALTLTYDRHGELDLAVSCRVLLETDSAMTRWAISVRNNTSYGVRAIRYPVIVAPTVLGESVEDDVFVWSWFGGQIRRQPGRTEPVHDRTEFVADGGRRSNWMPSQYPGPISVQLQAYYDDGAGLYMATYDDAGNVKRFGIARIPEGLDLSIEHNYDERPGLDFDLPYETMLGIFHGDWYTAADIYKAWARDQHWCSTRVAERTDLPYWLKEPRPWPITVARGNYGRIRGVLAHPPAEHPIARFWPARKCVLLIRQYAAIWETPVVTFMEGWEGIGAPGGPVGIFPPYEGEQNFKAAMEELNRDGNYPFMYLAGFHWCWKRPSTGYDDWDHFEREGRPMAALTDQGELMVSDMNSRTYMDGQKYFVALCTGSQKTQDLFVESFVRLMDLGSVAVQMDQQVGFYAEVCYSEEHDHPPGYGHWMVDKTLEFLDRTLEAIRSKRADAFLSVEAPCEIWNQKLGIVFHRPYSPHTVPLFDYLYHEYAMAFGGDALMGVCHPDASLMKHATAAVCGLQNAVGVGEAEYDFNVDPDYPILVLLRNICQAQRTYAHNYLVFGEMLRPTELQVSRVTVDLFRRPGTVDIPRVVHSVWRALNGRIGYVLVNWTGEPEDVRLELRPGAGGVVTIVGTGQPEPAPREVHEDAVTLTLSPRGVTLVEHD